jgi:hypothetical protein
MGQCTSAKDLWLNLEKVYQNKQDNSIKDNEGKYSPKSSDCNDSNSNNVECSSTNEEEDLEVFFLDEEEELLMFK